MRKEYDFRRGKRGPAIKSPGKTRSAIMIDDDVIEECRAKAKAAGRGYQTLMNDILRAALAGDVRSVMRKGMIEGKPPVRTVPFKSFPADEQAMFAACCKHWWRSPDEFAVIAEEGDLAADTLRPVRRDVIVLHMASGKARRYDAGDGSNWNDAFDDDLDAMFFPRT